MKTKLNLSLSRDLTLYGRSLLAEAFGISQLVYAASMFSVPNAIIKSFQAQLYSAKNDPEPAHDPQIGPQMIPLKYTNGVDSGTARTLKWRGWWLGEDRGMHVLAPKIMA